MSGMTNRNEAILLRRVASSIFIRRFPLLLGLLGFLAVAVSLDTADDASWTADGPGLTFDEGFNVDVGAYLVESVRRAGLSAIHPLTLHEIFTHPNYNPDHPPLGRWALGLMAMGLDPIVEHDDRRPYCITAARVASALAFGGLLWLIAALVSKWYGPHAGIGAALALLFMPRVFAHAHLAALETFMNLTYAACVLITADRLAPKDRLHWTDGLLPGLLLGLALLTKMQAVFLPPVLTVWLLWNWRWRGLLPLVVVAFTSFLVFLLGWPWLWSDPVGRFVEYFARSTDRAVLYCHYLGVRYADRDVPWHYPFVMTLVTTPLLHLWLGGWGLSPRGNDPKERRRRQLLIGAMVLPLLVFAIPGTAVYDGIRLFLVASPLFAVFVGIGFDRLTNWCRQQHLGSRPRYDAWVAAGALLLTCLVSLVRLQPCQLSYYNELTWGLGGAASLGFERTYWGDSATPEFLRRVQRHLPDGATVGIAPVLHPAILREMWPRHTWLRHRSDLKFVAYDDQRPPLPQYVIVIRRLADPWASLSPPPAGTKVLETVERSGVVLAELLELPTAN